MKKIEVLKSLHNCGVVAVVRGNSKETGKNISEACIKGGVKAIEVTYTNKYASDIISELTDKYKDSEDVVIGAGTVLDPETARIAIMSGAKYIVSPSFSQETAKLCNRYKVPYIPGVMTINEIMLAHESGADVVKLFPGGVFGKGFVKAIKGPLPHTNIMVTGGVNLENLESWITSGTDLVGIGGELNTLGEEGKFEEITLLCSKYIEVLTKARG